MKKILIIIALLAIGTSSFGQSQKLVKKLSDFICPCLDEKVKQDPKNGNMEEFQKCFAEAAAANQKDLAAEMKGDAQTFFRKVGEEVAKDLVEKCPSFKSIMMSLYSEMSDGKEDVSPFGELTLNEGDCEYLKTGTFSTEKIYMNGKEIANNDKTARAIFSTGQIKDVSKNGKEHTLSSIKYTSECKWDLTFTEIKSKSIEGVFKVGDTYTMEILGVEKETKQVYVKYTIGKMIMYAILKKQ